MGYKIKKSNDCLKCFIAILCIAFASDLPNYLSIVFLGDS